MKTLPRVQASRIAAVLGTAFISVTGLGAPAVTPVAGTPAGGASIPARASGRVSTAGQYQWPGLYFEAKFRGPDIYFETGPGDVILHVRVDDAPVGTLVKPRPGVWRINGLANGAHVVRVDAVTESQAAANTFKGFTLPRGSRALTLAPPNHQIEFIGDSHTVGYGNTSKTRDCTQDDVWSTTDSSAAFGPQVARHYDADYQINAISGRG